ncbi:MAG: flagellar hook-associated protein FlgL [Gallionella sp.]|jgi:flagellar hook-associated protein 3 FlgL|nr:flagellar hook-associated protein FlgL [Gallionella sp.]MCK9354969.1 flagellar hook-associated protein FlgL [Gallionella sp.]
MRISSNSMYDSNIAAMSLQQQRMLQTQQQVSTGRKFITPADDPVAAAQALSLSQSSAVNTQYSVNRGAARHTMSLTESILQSATSLLQDVRESAISAGNGALGVNDRQMIANALTGKLQALVGLANSNDGIGNFLFAGFQSKTQPFIDTPAGVAYAGDDGQRLIQVNASRQMPSSESGADVFMRVKNGNGTFVVQGGTNVNTGLSNQGTGVATVGNVTNATLLTGNNYEVTFFDDGNGGLTYNVTDLATFASPLVGVPYVAGQAIGFDGMQFSVSGTPINGDTFTVSPSSNESVFKTLSDMIANLNGPAAGFGGRLAYSINQIDRALDNVLTSRSSVGVRLNELDALEVSGEDLGVQYQQSLSALQDVDYTKALSDLSQQQIYLQAAQKSFAKVSGMSLFDYL